MVKAQRPYQQLLEDLQAAVGAAEVGGGVVDRAAAMLAGRVGCRLGEARGHLIRIAGEHHRDIHEVAAELLVVLESQVRHKDADRAARSMVDRAIRSAPAVWPEALVPGRPVSQDNAVPRDIAGRSDERIAQTERLAGLGWGEWDLTTGRVSWSEELYRIYERNPTDGPLSREESGNLILPEDQHVRAESAAAFARGETVDITYRIRAGGQVKHLRAVIDAVRDASGTPLRLYGIVQDVTSREIARVRLATVERELREHQQTLAAEHRLAAALQHIVLPIPAAPIDLPGLRVAIRYLPAERASRVGGDWYHAATTSDGRVLLAVGDVAGHGLQAATTMAQLRHAMAALAITTTTDPAALLGHLNQLLLSAGESATSTATAVIASYDPHTGALTWAQAGHPAPLRTRRGVTTSLPRPRGPLLGAVPGVRYVNATVELRREDLLVLYTDGLVEDRKRSLEEGLAPVISALNDISGQGSSAPLADLLERLTRANPDDDTCVLAARLRDYHP